MGYCSKCGIEVNSSRLSTIVSKEGIISVCEGCFKEEDAPIIKKPTTYQLRESEVPSSVYKRLSNMAGINAEEHGKKFRSEEIMKRKTLSRQEVSLKELVDRNFKESGLMGTADELIHNYHWVIMRGRRMKKLTQEQLAREIGESRAAIEAAEKGNISNGTNLVKKLESYLGIRIFTPEARKAMEEQKKELDLDDPDSGEITISDLREMRKETEGKIVGDDSMIGSDIELEEEIE